MTPQEEQAEIRRLSEERRRLLGRTNTAGLGHNQPPDARTLAEPTIEDLRQFLKENPAITDEDGARAAKLIFDRATLSLKAVDAERRSKTDPLNKQVREINADYHKFHNTDANRPGIWTKLLGELRSRMPMRAIPAHRRFSSMILAASIG